MKMEQKIQNLLKAIVSKYDDTHKYVKLYGHEDMKFKEVKLVFPESVIEELREYIAKQEDK